MWLAALPQYTSGQLVRSVSQSKKQSVKNNNPAPAAGMLFYASSGIEKFTCEVDFFSWEAGSTHYFCLQKWTYFLLLDKQGIVLCALIQEVSFFSRYNSPLLSDYLRFILVAHTQICLGPFIGTHIYTRTHIHTNVWLTSIHGYTLIHILIPTPVFSHMYIHRAKSVF